ncbi:MAG: hypothetical protein ABJA67_12800 [Chthonomonadales bacterium]
MKYSVQGADGQWYGPVDMETLQHWVSEGRVLPTTLLRAEETEQIISASEIGLSFAVSRKGADCVCLNCGRKTNPSRSNCGYCGVQHGHVTSTGRPLDKGCNVALLVVVIVVVQLVLLLGSLVGSMGK